MKSLKEQKDSLVAFHVGCGDLLPHFCLEAMDRTRAKDYHPLAVAQDQDITAPYALYAKMNPERDFFYM
jgi:hypothetical protein